MKKKLAAVALAVALVSLAVPALAFAGGYGQAADGARQGRGACFALCQATEALGGSMADLATTAAAHCGRGCFDGAQNRSQGAGCAASCNGYVDADGDGVCDSCGGKLEARADDKPEVVRDRLNVYHKETAPLKDFYAARNLLKTVDNQPTVAETTTAILSALGL